MKRAFRRSFVRPDAARDVGDELRFHLEMRTQEFMESGMSREDAEHAAKDAFGDIGAIGAELRSVNQHRSTARLWRARLQDFGGDVRFALRTLRINWGFTTAALATLALGIGSAVAVFSVLNGVLLRPLPYPSPERLVMLWFSSITYGTEMPLSSGFYLDAASTAAPFARTAAFRSWGYTLTSAGDAEQLAGARVTPSFFPVMSVQPSRGRALSEADAAPGAAKVVLIGDALWKRRFGGDPSIVGKRIELGGEAFSVVGIMPPGFGFPRGAELPSGLQFGSRTELWTPLVFEPNDRTNYGTQNLAAIARLKNEARVSDLRQALNAQLSQWLAANAPKLDFVYRFNDLRTQAGQHVGRALYLLFGAVALLLIIAGVNVANLLIARTSNREREFAVRAALGAGRARIARQLVTENLLLGVTGAVLGLGFAVWATRVMLSRVPGSLPRAEDIGVDWHVIGLAGGLAITLGALLGAAAVAQVRWRALATTLQQAGTRSTGGRSRSVARRALVAAEIALSLMLIIGAVLLTKSFLRFQRVDPGFSAPRTYTASVVLPLPGRFDPQRDGPAWIRFFGQLVRNVASAPGVERAAAVSALPVSGTAEGGGTAIVGAPEPGPGQALHAEYLVIEGDYFSTMGIRLLGGRAFTPADAEGSVPVIIVNREYARRYLGRDVIGRQLRAYFDFSRATPRTIVGMVDDVRNGALDGPPTPQVYVPEAQMAYPGLQIVVRMKSDAATALPILKREVHALDSRIAVANSRAMSAVIDEALAARRFSMTLIGMFAAFALTLVMVGLYGVIALSVSQRRKELGVRMALGARPGDISRLVMREALAIAGVGIVVGVVSAVAASRLVSAMLYAVSGTDPLVYFEGVVVVVLITLLASLLPAMRARRLDPALTLRAE
jgi:predicted permease